MKLFMKERLQILAPVPKSVNIFLDLTNIKTLILIQSFDEYLLSTSDCGECSKINERGHREMKYLVKFKEDLNVIMINCSEQRFSGGCVLISIWVRFFLLKCSRMYCFSKDGNKRDKTFNEG